MFGMSKAERARLSEVAGHLEKLAGVEPSGGDDPLPRLEFVTSRLAACLRTMREQAASGGGGKLTP